MGVLLLSTSDTDLLSARASGAGYRLANPARTPAGELPALMDGADVVVVRILGGARAWPDGLAALRASGLPVVALGGEQAPDAEMMEQSTVPAGVAAEAHTYLAQGGPANLGQLHAFLSDTLLFTGQGFDPPVEMPSWGIFERAARDVDNTDGRGDDGVVVPAPGHLAEYREAGLEGRRLHTRGGQKSRSEEREK